MPPLNLARRHPYPHTKRETTTYEDKYREDKEE
nr:MAG TPA: hypothetical protein [Caudoviricetes sp.]